MLHEIKGDLQVTALVSVAKMSNVDRKQCVMFKIVLFLLCTCSPTGCCVALCTILYAKILNWKLRNSARELNSGAGQMVAPTATSTLAWSPVWLQWCRNWSRPRVQPPQTQKALLILLQRQQLYLKNIEMQQQS